MKFNFKLPVLDNSLFTWDGNEVKVKQYLPVVQKAALVNEIINAVVDEKGYWNPISLDVWFTIHMTFAYTDIELDEENDLNGLQLYDYLITSGLWDTIKGHIPTKELEAIYTAADITLKNIYTYKNSALGIMEAIATDYEDLNLDAEEIREKLSNPESLATLRNVLDKMG